MNERRQASLLGMAVMRGLVSPAALGQAALQGQGERLLDEVVAKGLLDADDIRDLSALLETHGLSEPGDGGPPTQAQDAGAPEDATAAEPAAPPSPRGVLGALRLSSWKHYRDLRFQGQGGMGRIFRAFDPVLKREVALKFLSRDEPVRLLRFVLEAQHQAMVDHPNICKVYEVGDWNGQSYIAMQYIRGETLAEARERLSLDDVAAIMGTVAQAIHAAHRQGLIHRDLKPSNIMVERDEWGLKPYVLDFGLARGQEDSGLTQHGVAVGTMGFMSPEQARGDEGTVSFQTDIYAMGATLYMLLAGDPPFAESTGLELLRRTLEEEPRSLRSLRPGIPRDLETIVLKCLEKEPARRYASAQALAEDLRRFREGEPILAHPPALTYLLQKRARKHKPLVAVTGIALAAVVLFAGFGVQARRHAAAQAHWAQHYGQEAERLEALLRYAHLLPAHDIRRELLQVRERMAEVERHAASETRTVVGPASYALGRGCLAMGDLAEAASHLERALDLGFRTPEAYHVHGRILGLQYQAELDRLRRIPDPSIRLAQKHLAEHRLRDAALADLERGRNASLEPAAYDRALLALYGSRFEEALASARLAFAQTPWFYEAKALEGDILLEKASREAAGPRLLEEAIACFHAAQAIAPSDPGLHHREARAWRLALDQGWSRGEDPAVPCQRGLACLEKERAVDPARAEIPALEAWFHFGRARHLNNRGKDARAPLQEALRATDLALARDPRHLEALHARMEAWGALALAQWMAGEDPQETWTKAIEAGQRAMLLAPQDSQLIQGLSTIHLRAMAYQAMHGRAYRASWEAARALMERGVQAFPEVAVFQLGLGEVHEEWAEQEKIHGRDPAEAIRNAIASLDRALRLDPRAFEAHYYRGIVRMTQGEYLLLAHGDPRPAFREALECLARARSLKPDHTSSLNDLAECRLNLARTALARGESPLEELAAARRAIDETRARNHNPVYGDYQVAKCDLVEIQWTLGQHPGAPVPGGLFNRAESHFRRWLKASENQVAWGELAELYRCRAEGGDREALERGIQAARRAVELDPAYGLGHFRLADLELLASRFGRTEAAARARAAYTRAHELDPRLPLQKDL